MTEWWTYSLRDFLMFSPRTYYRLFELYNAQWWPVHMVAFALGAIVLAQLVRPGRASARLTTAILAGCWLWVAYGYFLGQYSSIHWAGRYVAGAFAVEGGLLLAAGMTGRVTIRRGVSTSEWGALLLLVTALIVYPLIAVIVGRGAAQAEVFGMAPDPTVIGTLAVLSLSGRAPWLLMLIPVAWCVMSAATLWVMASPEALVLPALMFVGVALSLSRRAALKRVS